MGLFYKYKCRKCRKKYFELPVNCDNCGTTLRAAVELGRSAYGFEIDRTFYQRAKDEMLVFEKDNQMNLFDFMGG